MIKINSVEESTKAQQELFAKGYWWLGGVRDVYLPHHKEYCLMYGELPGRIYYCLPQT